jgi:hypothetical protein
MLYCTENNQLIEVKRNRTLQRQLGTRNGERGTSIHEQKIWETNIAQRLFWANLTLGG